MDQLQRFRSRPALVICACGALVAAVAIADVAKADRVAGLGRPAATSGDVVRGPLRAVGRAGAYRLTFSLGAPSRKR
jgi:hypothetical protein